MSRQFRLMVKESCERTGLPTVCRHCGLVVKELCAAQACLTSGSAVNGEVSSPSIIAPDVLSGIDPQVNKVVRDIMSSSEYIVNKFLKDMDKLTNFRDSLKEIMDKTDEETRGIPLVKQKDIVASFVPPQNGLSTETVRVPSVCEMASSSTNYKYQKSEEAIEILIKGQEKEKKDDRIMRNSFCILNGLVISDIRSNISTLSELLDETKEDGGVIAREYMLN
ncbi:hypothetical protein E3N88_29101 [Mikania micrantha]|uniref:Uncharacterized protein n=1 Tax=Mikania micrantha TaxID=192012 RepID=A0A5N6N2M0_9ASTR|nr:hypothetical protein E3N88_29101 [Mikania micrantha]